MRLQQYAYVRLLQAFFYVFYTFLYVYFHMIGKCIARFL